MKIIYKDSYIEYVYIIPDEWNVDPRISKEDLIILIENKNKENKEKE